MKLLGNPRSPYVRKVIIALREKGAAYDYVEVSAGDPAVGAANPLSKIPTLIRNDGSVVFDSPVIAEYVDVAAAFLGGDEVGMVNAVLDRLARKTRPQEFSAR